MTNFHRNFDLVKSILYNETLGTSPETTTRRLALVDSCEDQGLAGAVKALRALIKERPTDKVIIVLLLLLLLSSASIPGELFLEIAGFGSCINLKEE